MKNKKRKIELLENGTYKEFSQTRFNYIKALKECENENDIYDETKEYLKIKYKTDFESLEQIRKARHEQIKKIKDFLNYYLSLSNLYEIYFITFTWDTKKRKKGKENITAETLKKYVMRALTDVIDFKVNIDYGDLNERLHYHALVIIEKNDKKIKVERTTQIYKTKKQTLRKRKNLSFNNKYFNEYIEKVGYIGIRKLKATKKDIQKIANYQSKLISHAIKVKQKYISSKPKAPYQQYKKALEHYLKLKKANDFKIGPQGAPIYIQNALFQAQNQTKQEQTDINL